MLLKARNLQAFVWMLFLASVVFTQDIPQDQYFYVQSMNNAGKNWGGYWDVSGGPKSVDKPQNIKVWNHDKGVDRLYKFVNLGNGFYKIVPKHGESNSAVRWEEKNGDGCNFYIDNNPMAPNSQFKVDYAGNGRWRIRSSDGRVVCLDGRSSKNGSNVHLWTDHGGEWTEWALLSEKGVKWYKPKEYKNLSHIKPKGLTGQNAQKLISNLDKTYAEACNLQSRLEKVNGPVQKAKDVLDKTAVVSGKLNKLDDRVKRAHGAFSAFTKLPIIGAPVSALTVTLNMAKKNIDKANDKVKSFEKPVVRPACDNFNALAEATNNLGAKLTALKSELRDIKEKYIFSADCVNGSGNAALKSSFEGKSGAMASRLETVNTELARVNSGITEMEKVAKSISKMERSLNKVDNGIKKVDKAFNKTDKAAKEINKVLNKSFKKKIGFVKINISLKKVLSGGKVGKVFKKFVNKWMNKLLKPVVKKLNIKIPSVEGVEELQRDVDKIKTSLAAITESANMVTNSIGSVDAARGELKNQLAACVGDCESNGTAKGG